MPDDQKPFIVLIDDDYVFANTVKSALEHAGMRMERAGNGGDGILMVKQLLAKGDKPDVILLDIAMPGLNGLEVLDRLHADRELRHVPIVVLSNFTNEEDISWAKKQGAAQTINKTSIVPADLPDMLRELIG